jgi:hypothetical protein
MASIEEPIRISSPKQHRCRWPRFTNLTKLPPPRGVDRSLLSILSTRRSATTFGPLSLEDLSSWLYFTASSQDRNREDENRKRGFAPSFGALQSTHFLVGTPANSWSLYLPAEHCLAHLDDVLAAGRNLRSLAMGLFEAPAACTLALVNDDDLVSDYYEHPESLQLREAGVLLGHGALVAEAWGLPFRILGALGSPWSNALLANVPVKLTATGIALLGGPSDRSVNA